MHLLRMRGGQLEIGWEDDWTPVAQFGGLVMWSGEPGKNQRYRAIATAVQTAVTLLLPRIEQELATVLSGRQHRWPLPPQSRRRSTRRWMNGNEST